MTKKFILFSLLIAPFTTMAQFHTVNVPKPSPKVIETQQLGITDITISYHSPAVKGRDVWNGVVNSYGPSLPWRAGANMNTTFKFTTDVMIEGQNLKAGSYGFHVILKEGDSWTLVFAHHDNQWGSYYLDLEKHVALTVDVKPLETVFSEQLDYRFINRTDSSLLIALEWGEKRIPINVSVDLNKTVIENFRYELLGINTYRWEAWNDAANWCLSRNTNLEEALEWANRSINGGYTGFAANKNFTNLSTKGNILWRLEKKDESDAAFKEAIGIMSDPNDTYGVGRSLLDSGRTNLSLQVFEKAAEIFDQTWYIYLGYARALYKSKSTKKGIKTMENGLTLAPENYKDYVRGLITKMKNGDAI